MGDAIVDNVWDGEDQVDLSNYRSDEDFEGSASEAEAIAEESNKNSKKRKKFEQLKLKKKMKLSELEESKASQEESKPTKPLPFTVEEMVDLLEANRPGNVRPVNDVDFTVDDFVYAGLDETTTTKSKKNKICPFVRTLSANMPNYKKLLMNTSLPKEDRGCPMLLILCSSAIRATQIIKSISAKLIKCKIAKLFAKHFKVEEQMEMLAKDYYPIALGTPNRVKKLIELGSLSLRRTALVLVDVTPDSKQFNILTLNEVGTDLYRLLYDQILPEKAHLKLALVRE